MCVVLKQLPCICPSCWPPVNTLGVSTAGQQGAGKKRKDGKDGSGAYHCRWSTTKGKGPATCRLKDLRIEELRTLVAHCVFGTFGELMLRALQLYLQSKSEATDAVLESNSAANSSAKRMLNPDSYSDSCSGSPSLKLLGDPAPTCAGANSAVAVLAKRACPMPDHLRSKATSASQRRGYRTGEWRAVELSTHSCLGVSAWRGKK